MPLNNSVGLSQPLDSAQFNPLYVGPGIHSEGLVYWDRVAHTFSIMTDIENVVLQVGQEQHIRVINNTGSTIANGSVVYQSGVIAGLPSIAKAQSNDISTTIILGVVTEDIADSNTSGIVTSSGYVRDIDTSSFAAGDTLYLSSTTSGALTNVLPDSPAYGVVVGTCVVSDANVGKIYVNIQQAQITQGITQSKIYTLPLRGVTGVNPKITGELRTVAAGETGDYATDFAVSNNHVFLLVNTITGVGDITITGTSLSESTAVPVIGDTETITVDTSINQYYQTTKKWWEVTNIDIPAGITSIDYDIGVVGYTDFGNTTFKITGYRLDTTSQNVNPEIRFRIIKVQDDGNKKMSILDIEDITIDSGAAGNQIVDNIRGGANSRNLNPAVADIWGVNTVAVLKQSDFDTYFTSNENVFSGADSDEGFILAVEQENNVDFITLRIDYQLIV